MIFQRRQEILRVSGSWDKNISKASQEAHLYGRNRIIQVFQRE
jgi:hypothetical protein